LTLRRYHLFIIYALLGFLIVFVIFQKAKEIDPAVFGEEIVIESERGDKMTMTIPEPKIRLFALPEKISFADEPVPLKEEDVKERFEREIYVNVYWQSNMILLMKRAGKFLPTIEKILKQQGVPDDFKYLAMAESGLLNVVSPAGARGFWQFMPGTAKDFNLEVSNDVDERYHLEKSTIAACKYLKSAYSKFGNWTSVAASYNMGITGIGKRKQEQNQSDYYDLHLVEETSRYLFRILAFKEIFENPVKYGFEFSEQDIYSQPVYRELMVDQSIPSLAQWAIRHNSNYKILKIHNPWLRSSKLSVKKGKEYLIKLPVS
jgi:membrane-bound lytic murein transglycosylase D